VTILELQSQHAAPLEVVHETRWMASLLDRSPVPASGAPADPGEQGLRTFIAIRDDQFDAAESLVQRRYSARGYAPESLERAAPPGASVTLLAQAGGHLLGTLTVRPDGPRGLFAERTYCEEVASLRAAGHRLGELVKLATVEEADWKTALDALVQSAYLVTRIVHRLSDVLIEVNPRHVRFYRRVFGFVEAGGKRVCERVGAPSVLMRLDLDQFGRRLRLAS